MQVLHMYEDEEGISHFADTTIGLTSQVFAPPAPELLLSAYEPVTNIVHLILTAGWKGAKHPSPKRQIAYCLAGQLEVIAGDGERREISVGGIWRMEDTKGEGHVSNVIGETDVRLVIAQLE